MSRIRQSAAKRSSSATMLFRALSPEIREDLASHLPIRSFADGQIIQLRGDVADGIWLIEEGSVSLGQFAGDGDFRGLALLGPGDSYGELAVLGGRPKVVDAVARGEVRLKAIPRHAYEAALASDPAVVRMVLGAIARQFQETLNLLAGFRRGSTASRMAALLANLSGGTPGLVAITQQELGDLLGVSRASALSALAELEREGLARRGYGKLEIVDPAGLRALSIAGRASG
ncbi:Crp/Fnr family transcriptional regulator [Tsuneonella amylolytica]|uniref:Crp/Fnr family transcriptional regulator n=1 Tax=Tsuneonella amylolytica TaxID=2338327 RepID=UPI0013C4818E|nr:Crp/Fnr family transcriptional regulator [Tsuneonella amylolytica]